MTTIDEYIKYYKDTSIKDIGFNQIDNLLFAVLVYLPIGAFKEKTFDELYDYSKDFTDKKNDSAMASRAFEYLEKIKGSKRYKNMIFKNYVNVVNDSMQFGACTIRLEDITVICYKGTDRSLIGWIENARIGYDYPTNTQKTAIDYLKNNITKEDKKVYVVGHSKGGNLALVSGMEASEENFDKIIKVYNFDGPGLRYKEYSSDKYERLRSKLVNVMPSGSVIGTLLYNKDYIVVNSKNVSFGEHYPDSWGVYGEFFITNTLSKSSLKLHDSTTIGIKDLDEKEMKNAFETVFKNIELDYTSKFKLDLDDLQKTYRNMKDLDPKAKEYLDTMFSSMLKALNVKR